MPNPFDIPETSPAKVFALREGAFAHDLFITAVGYLDFFNRLAEGPADIGAICHKLNIKERPADVMLTLFKSYGLVSENNGLYSPTDAARDYLTASSNYDLSSYVNSLKDRPTCLAMAEVLRTRRPANWAAAQTGKEWAAAMADDGFAASFTAGMNSRGAYLAAGLVKSLDLKGYKRLLDIGGASGVYAAALTTAFPHLQATVLEKPPVDKVATYSIDKLGMTDNISVTAGDMFRDELPDGYDIHLLSHVLHDWDVPEVKSVLTNSYRHLEAGGIIIIHDAHINEAKTGPVSVAEYSVLLMCLSEGKCYSIGEMTNLLQEAGFRDIECKPTILNRSVITGRK